jgi:hypothetical protein
MFVFVSLSLLCVRVSHPIRVVYFVTSKHARWHSLPHFELIRLRESRVLASAIITYMVGGKPLHNDATPSYLTILTKAS